MQEKDSFILDIKRLGINGEGLGFYNRMAVFVEDAIPGEGHSIMINKVEGKMAFGTSLEIKRKSPHRIAPLCPHYEECGGCNVSHIEYNQMLKFKRELLMESLERYTTLPYRQFEIKQTVPSELQYGYRNRSQLAVRKNLDDQFVCTMLKAKTNQIVNIDHCLVQDSKINDLNREILKIADELGLSPYQPKYNRGVLRYLVIRVNQKKEALVCLICAEKNPKIKELARRTMSLLGVVGVYENFNDSKREGIFFGEEMHLLEGKPAIIEQLGRIQYKIYPNTFFQLNAPQAKNMYDIILKACKLSFKETVLDAYCGVGSIGLYLAKMAKEVIGIEYNKDSVEAAIENAALNKITNAKFLQGDAVQLLPKLLSDGICFDVIVVDPPRTGLGEVFIQSILDAKIPRVVYASCNPATLAKDLEILSSLYNVKYITPIDMFPQTSLVESVCQLVLKDKTK